MWTRAFEIGVVIAYAWFTVSALLGLFLGRVVSIADAHEAAQRGGTGR